MKRRLLLLGERIDGSSVSFLRLPDVSRFGCDMPARADCCHSGQFLWLHQLQQGAFQKQLSAVLCGEYALRLFLTEADSSCVKLRGAGQARQSVRHRHSIEHPVNFQSKKPRAASSSTA